MPRCLNLWKAKFLYLNRNLDSDAEYPLFFAHFAQLNRRALLRFVGIDVDQMRELSNLKYLYIYGVPVPEFSSALQTRYRTHENKKTVEDGFNFRGPNRRNVELIKIYFIKIKINFWFINLSNKLGL